MPKDPKRNIPNYQLQGGHLNEFEFQKSQGEMAEESELPFTDEADKAPDQVRRIARVAAEAHRKVEKRKKRGVVSAGGRQRIVPDKRSAKKSTRKPAKKITTRPRMKSRANVKSGR